MSEDKYVEVSNESWFSRIGSSIRGVIAGLILFLIAFPVLFFNESRAVSTYKAISEGANSVSSISAETVIPENEGKLIHITGKMETNDILNDKLFNISVNAIKLKRDVQIYQWKETTKSKTKKKVGGSTETIKEYTYNKQWVSQPIIADTFKKKQGHENKVAMECNKISYQAKDVRIGSYSISKSLIDKIGGKNDYEPYILESDSMVFTDMADKAKFNSGGIYIGNNPQSPEIGDIKVTFQVISPQPVSIVSQQTGNTFEPFIASNGKKIEYIRPGTVSAEAIFDFAKSSNSTTTWLIRFVGFIMMFIGVTAVFRPLSVVADVLPILGNLVGAFTGFIAFLIAGITSVLVIAISWIVFRPLIGGILLVVVVGLSCMLKKKVLSKQKQTT